MEEEKSNYEKVVEAMKVLEKYPKEREMYESIKTEEFLQRISENNIREEGREKGREEGERKSKIETARRMLRKNMEIKEIAYITDLTEEEIEKIKKQIY